MATANFLVRLPPPSAEKVPDDGEMKAFFFSFFFVIPALVV